MGNISKFVCDQCQNETVDNLPDKWVRIEGQIQVFAADSNQTIQGPLEFCSRYCLGYYLDGIVEKPYLSIPEQPDNVGVPVIAATSEVTSTRETLDDPF